MQNSNSIESKNKLDVFLQSNFTDSDKTVESFNSRLFDNALQSAKLVKKKAPMLRTKKRDRIVTPGSQSHVEIYAIQ